MVGGAGGELVSGANSHLQFLWECVLDALHHTAERYGVHFKGESWNEFYSVYRESVAGEASESSSVTFK